MSAQLTIYFGYKQHAAPRALNHYRSLSKDMLASADQCHPTIIALSLHVRCVHLIHNDRPSFLFIRQHPRRPRRHISISLSPHPLHQRHKLGTNTIASTQQPPANSDISTLTTSPLPCHLQRATNCLPRRPTLVRRFFSAEVISTANRACVDPSFIFVVVGLCWLIVWAGEGACARCCHHVIYCLYYPCG